MGLSQLSEFLPSPDTRDRNQYPSCTSFSSIQHTHTHTSDQPYPTQRLTRAILIQAHFLLFLNSLSSQQAVCLSIVSSYHIGRIFKRFEKSRLGY